MLISPLQDRTELSGLHLSTIPHNLRIRLLPKESEQTLSVRGTSISLMEFGEEWRRIIRNCSHLKWQRIRQKGWESRKNSQIQSFSLRVRKLHLSAVRIWLSMGHCVLGFSFDGHAGFAESQNRRVASANFKGPHIKLMLAITARNSSTMISKHIKCDLFSIPSLRFIASILSSRKPSPALACVITAARNG